MTSCSMYVRDATEPPRQSTVIDGDESDVVATSSPVNVPAVPSERVLYFFFFQAEDGIRVVAVTGVQTCALPICRFQRPGARWKWFPGRAFRRPESRRDPGRRNARPGNHFHRSEEHTSELQS